MSQAPLFAAAPQISVHYLHSDLDFVSQGQRSVSAANELYPVQSRNSWMRDHETAGY